MLIKNSGTVEEITTAAEDIPVFIVNRNLLTTTRALVDWLRIAGTKNITIVDNESTYEPLLAWYETKPCEVHQMGRNAGPWASWDWASSVSETAFVYSDSDIVPASFCPTDLIKVCVDMFNENPAACIPHCGKIGPSHRIDDAPDIIQKREEEFWKYRTGEYSHQAKPTHPCFSARIDTTFALYYPKSPFTNGWENVRLDVPYSAEHVSWYPSHPLKDEAEYAYYAAHSGFPGCGSYVNAGKNSWR